MTITSFDPAENPRSWSAFGLSWLWRLLWLKSRSSRQKHTLRQWCFSWYFISSSRHNVIGLSFKRPKTRKVGTWLRPQLISLVAESLGYESAFFQDVVMNLHDLCLSSSSLISKTPFPLASGKLGVTFHSLTISVQSFPLSSTFPMYLLESSISNGVCLVSELKAENYNFLCSKSAECYSEYLCTNAELWHHFLVIKMVIVNM